MKLLINADPKFPFILSVFFFFCVILFIPECLARVSMESSSSPPNSAPNSQPTSSPFEAPSTNLFSSATFPGSVSEILKRIMLKHKENLNLLPSSSSSSSSSSPSIQTNPALKSICDSTDYPEICVSTISPMLVSRKVDTINVLESAMKACIQTLKGAVSATSSLSISSSGAASGSALAECKNSYKDALDNLQNALSALQSRDMGTINSLLSAVVADISTCGDAIKGMKLPMADYDALISRMASNCLVVASLIHSTK